MRTILKLAPVLVVAGVLGFLAYMFIWYQGSYAALNNQTAYLKAALNNKALLYGTLRTVDTSTMTLTIDTVNNYQAGGDPIVYTFPLLSGIFIVQQELVIKDGVYVRSEERRVGKECRS